MPNEADLRAQLVRLAAELDRRTIRHRKVEPYYEVREGLSPVPAAITEARLTNAYRHLTGMSGVPWGKAVVNSKLDRLEVTGIQSGDKDVDDTLWGFWQDNRMDLESKLGHASALLDGRCHALVWPSLRDGVPRVTLDDTTQMVVEYEEGSRHERVAALRRWVDSDLSEYVTLYRPDGIYKFRRKKPTEIGEEWQRRDVPGEEWPLPNPLGVVPVVEIGVNRRLKPGSFPHARGEYEDAMGLMDRINLLTFLGLVVALYMGFPLRGVIGDKIMVDDEGKQIAPFDANADSVFQLENPDAKLAEFKAADRKNLSVFAELTELAAATSTPRHYLPMEGGINNVSEPTIRAFEGGMHATVNASHKPSLGEGWEEVLRLGGMMLKVPVVLPARAGLLWADHESRSLGERADAALKLSQAGVPWQGVADLALNLGQDQIRRYEAEQSGTALGQLLRDAQRPTDTRIPAPAA